MLDRELIVYRRGWEPRVQALDRAAARRSHRVHVLDSGRPDLAWPESISSNMAFLGELRSAAAEGLAWLVAHPSPSPEVDRGYRLAWHIYIEASDVLVDIASSALLTTQESADRAHRAWTSARIEGRHAMESFSEAVRPHP
ncbi:MAG TPA: hypothetical protein VIX84_03430 [Acidimicrobiales bacterium]